MGPVEQVCERLLRDSNALSIVLLDAEGQPIAAVGDAALLDAKVVQSFCSASGKTLPTLVDDREFAGHLDRPARNRVHLSAVAQHAILAVLFDDCSSLGLVRLRVRKATDELARLLTTDTGSGGPPPASPTGAGGSSAPAQRDDPAATEAAYFPASWLQK